MKSITLKVGGATWGHFGRFVPFHNASNVCTHFFFCPSCAQQSPCCNNQNPTQIGHLMWKIMVPKILFLNLALTFGQHIEPAPKTSNANLTRNRTCLEYEVFICYFGPHDNGCNHPTPVDTFLACRLPPRGPWNPIKIFIGDDLFWVAWAFKNSVNIFIYHLETTALWFSRESTSLTPSWRTFSPICLLASWTLQLISFHCYTLSHVKRCHARGTQNCCGP